MDITGISRMSFIFRVLIPVVYMACGGQRDLCIGKLRSINTLPLLDITYYRNSFIYVCLAYYFCWIFWSFLVFFFVLDIFCLLNSRLVLVHDILSNDASSILVFSQLSSSINVSIGWIHKKYRLGHQFEK